MSEKMRRFHCLDAKQSSRLEELLAGNNVKATVFGRLPLPCNLNTAKHIASAVVLAPGLEKCVSRRASPPAPCAEVIRGVRDFGACVMICGFA